MASPTALYQARLRVIGQRTAASVGSLWDQLEDHDRPQAQAFATRAAPIVAGGQLLAARLTGAYVARRAGIPAVALPRAAVVGPAARRGVELTDEYQRPFGALWGALGEGLDRTEAVARGRARLDLLVVTDVWLAMRAATAVIDRVTPRITGWMRVADAGACDQCAAADGTPYGQAADLAGHPNCGCTSEPTFADSPPSEAADPEAIGVQDHGELGPVLVPAGAQSTE